MSRVLGSLIWINVLVGGKVVSCEYHFFFFSRGCFFYLNESRNIRVIYGPDYAINCTAYLLGCPPGKQGQAHLYPPRENEGTKFLDWVERLVRTTIKQTSTGV